MRDEIDDYVDETEEPEDDYQYCPVSGLPYNQCDCEDCSEEDI